MTNEKNKMVIGINFRPGEADIYKEFHDYLKNNPERYRGNISSLGVELIRDALKQKCKEHAAID